MFNFMSIFKKAQQPKGEWAYVTASDLWQLPIDEYNQLGIWYPIYNDDGSDPVYYRVIKMNKTWRLAIYNAIVDNRMGRELSLDPVNGHFKFYVFVPQNLVDKYGIED